MAEFPAPPSSIDSVARSDIATLQATLARMTGNTVFVNSRADLPAAIAGVITLAGNTTYELTDNVNISPDRIVGSLRVMFRAQNNNQKLETSNVLPLITWEGDFQTESIRFVNDIGPCFDIDSFGGPGSFSELKILNTNINSFGRDQFRDSAPTILQNIEFNQDFDGIEFPGTYPFGLRITDVNFFIPVGPSATTFITFPPTHVSAVTDIRNCIFEISNPITIGIDFQAGATVSNVSSISGCKAIGSGNALATGTIDSSTIEWRFSGNDSTSGQLQDSSVAGAAQYIGNALATPVGSTGVWIAIESTVAFTFSSLGERFEAIGASGNDPGGIRFIGLNPISKTLTMRVTIDKANGARDYLFRLMRNGSPVPDSIFEGAFRDSRVSFSWDAVTELVTGDEFKIEFQQMASGTQDLTFTAAQMSG